MKPRLLAVLLCGWNVSASAIPLYEPFNYDNITTTNLIGRINSYASIQWYQAGPNAGLTNQPWIDSGSLEYPGRPPARGNKVRFGGIGTSARFSFKDIDAAITGTLYYSFVFRIRDTSTLNDTGIFWAGFNNTQGSQTTTPTVVLARLITKRDVTNNIPGNYLVGLSKTSGNVGDFLFATNSFSTNDIVFVVVSYTWVGDTTDNLDYAQLWLNPDPSTFGAATPPPPTLVSMAGNDSGNARSFVLFNRHVNQPADIELDDLIIGNTWADVTPGTNSMLAAGPVSQTVVAGNDVYFDTRALLADSLQWRFNGVDILGATNEVLIISNAQPVNAGTYSVVYSNLAGVVVSNATLSVVDPAGYPTLSPLWSLAPGDRPYITTSSADAPRQRSIAYSSLSNQLLIVDAGPAATTPDYAIYVLHGDTGADLYALNTDSTIVFNNTDSSADRELNAVEVGADGAVYACNMTFNAGASGRGFKLYRWANSASNTVPELLYGPAEPASSPTQHRWGDTLAVRGVGNSTEILIDEDTGMYAALIGYDPMFSAWISTGFFQTKPRPTLGRSLQFGSGDTLWQKARALQYATRGPLERWGYDLMLQVATNQLSLDVLSRDVGPLAVDASQNLIAALSFTPISGAPDKLALYDISDPNNPVLITRYPFPVAHQGNNQSFGKVVISGNRIYALNANNGLIALVIEPPRPRLRIQLSGTDVLVSWPTNFSGYTLQSTLSLTPPVNWADLGPGSVVGDQYVVTQPASGAARFYRLSKPQP